MPRNKKQSHSPQQSEYMALAECGKECIYLRTILHELRFETLECITIFCDNCSAIKLAKNPTFHARSKHIDIRHHFIREALESGQLEV